MYGIVNQAIAEMVCTQSGDQLWLRVLKRAGISEDGFLSNTPYPDCVTYALVSAVCSETGRTSDDVLEDFGRHWLLETGRKRYGGLLEAGGHDMMQFLLNLPNFHARICMILPELQPPEFVTDAVGEQSVRLRYFSQRPGLTPFVRGLLLGLGTLYGQSAQVTLLHPRTCQDDFDEFLITWQEI